MKINFLQKKYLFGIIAFLMLLSCSPTGTSNVTIHINLGVDNKAALNAPEKSIFDGIFSFFIKKAEAQTAPSNITSLTLNITSSGTELIPSQRYTSPDIPSSISVEVPAGNSRTFEVLAAIDPSDPGTILTYRGTSTRDLNSGSTVDIPISMGIYETKIIIPDYQNSRVVQINNITGAGWIEISMNQPYDVDFDSSGRIYISNNNRINRMNGIEGTSVDYKFFDAANYQAIAIDRTNNFIYYYRNSTQLLYRDSLVETPEPSVQTPLPLPGITFTNIRGLAVDDYGSLYIAATISEGNRVIKYNPTTTEISQYSNDLLLSWDVIVKNGNLYVADYDNVSFNSSKIIQLSLDLNYSAQLGTAGASPFYGPHRFLAILNNRFYLIDECEDWSVSDTERIVAFDNFSSIQETFNPLMVEESIFNFYGAC
jgi:hypothetical protein